MDLAELYSYMCAYPPIIGRYELISNIEYLIVNIIKDLTTKGYVNIQINGNYFPRIHHTNERALGNGQKCHRISYGRRHNNVQFAQLMFLLAEVHQLLTIGGSCSPRELFYKEKQLIRTQASINRTIRKVCDLLQTTTWQLGIIASGKGLVAGDLRIHLCSGGVIDCSAHNGPVLLPQDFSCVAHLQTNAAFGLIVEKDTVFSKLIANNLFESLDAKMILITGKGYPDLSTRALAYRLCNECKLPMYILVDADPYGIHIMLLYRYGSKRNRTEQLACPQIHWIGIHPSELLMLPISTIPLTTNDQTKIANLLKTAELEECVQQELLLMQHLGRKAEIEALSSNYIDFFINGYLFSKIKSHLASTRYLIDIDSVIETI